MTRQATRGQFWAAGLAGGLAGLALTVLFWLILPRLGGLAPLAAARWGTSLGAVAFLLAIGFVAVAELPIMLIAMSRMARRGLPAWMMAGTHTLYAFFPLFYGVLGAQLTGERWWLLVMGGLILLRLAMSLVLFLTGPDEMAARHAATLPPDPAAAEAPPDAAPPPASPLRAVEGFILDMDGVLYRGNQPRTGARPFLDYLNAQGIPYVCLTNNASRTSAMYQEKLDRLGLPVDSAHVIGAAQAAAEWLAAQAAPGARVLPIGEAGLRAELERVGLTLVAEPPAEWVVVGIDFGLSYERLKQAALALRGGARFVGTNPDTTFPSEEGLVPGNGATLAYLAAATGQEPTIIGKPQRAMMQVALDHLGLPPARVAMVGDRLNTDILGGQRAGLLTILLRGGVTSDEELAASDLQPDLLFEDLGALLAAYRPAESAPPPEAPPAAPRGARAYAAPAPPADAGH